MPNGKNNQRQPAATGPKDEVVINLEELEKAVPPSPPKALTPEAMGLEPRKPLFSKKLLIVIGATLLVLIISSGFFFYLRNLAPAKVSIKVNVPGATIKINNQVFSNVSGQLDLGLKPGAYSLSVSAPDYFPITEKPIEIRGMKQNLFSEELLPMPEITKVSSEPMLYPALTAEGREAVFLAKAGNEFRKINLENLKTVPASPSTMAQIQDVSWAPDRGMAALKVKNDIKTLQAGGSPMVNPEVDDGVILDWIYDFSRWDLVSQKATALHPAIKDCVFSAYGDKIIYIFSSKTETTLVQADLDGKNFVRLANILPVVTAFNLPGEEIKIVPSPDAKKIILFPKDPNRRGGLWIYNIITGELKEFSDSQTSWGAVFSPSGKEILFSDETEGERRLFSATSEGKNITDLGISTDLEKAIWYDSNNIIFAVSEEGGDKIYNLNLKTKQKEPLAYKTPSEPLAITKLLLPMTLPSVPTKKTTVAETAKVSGKLLYFVSGENLYKLELKI